MCPLLRLFSLSLKPSSSSATPQSGAAAPYYVPSSSTAAPTSSMPAVYDPRAQLRQTQPQVPLEFAESLLGLIFCRLSMASPVLHHPRFACLVWYANLLLPFSLPRLDRALVHLLLISNC